MADKKLNEVTTVDSGTLANVKNFLAVMNDGSIQQMSKEDMASVVGGLISKEQEFLDDILSPIFIDLAIASNITVSEFKKQLSEKIQELVLPKKNLFKRNIFLYANSLAQILDNWNNPDYVLANSGAVIIQLLCTTSADNGYAKLLITSYGKETLWADMINGVID